MGNKVVLVTSHSPFSPYSISSPRGFIIVDPISPQIPLGVAYIAASLEKAGFDVKIVDLTLVNQKGYNVNEVKTTVLDLEPDIIGISAITATIPDVYRLAYAIKEEKKAVPIIVGGPHVSALPNRTLAECSAIDAAIVGEGDLVFPNFLKILLNKGVCNELAGLKGVLFRYNNTFFGNPNPLYVDDLDLLPFPAKHLFNIDKYAKLSYSLHASNYPVESIITSRGCPFSCLFCSRSSSGDRFRARSPENVVLELEQIKRYGFNEVQIMDDNFTFDRNRVIEICRLIKSKKLDMSFNLSNGIRVDRVDEELLSAMYDVGFYSIYFGVESGDDEVLRRIRKGITVRQVKNAVHIAKKVGFQVALFTIIGLPGSSVGSEEKTIRLIEESRAHAAVASVCTPYPGSPLWDMNKERLQGIPWERYIETDVSNPIYLPNGLTRKQFKLIIEKYKESKNIQID